jgi:hypothetical protein
MDDAKEHSNYILNWLSKHEVYATLTDLSVTSQIRVTTCSRLIYLMSSSCCRVILYGIYKQIKKLILCNLHRYT